MPREHTPLVIEKKGDVDGYELGKHYEDEIYPNSSYYTQTFKSDE